MDDFVFGSLSSDESRIAQLQARREGITHNHQRIPRDPQPSQPVQVDLTLGPAHPQTRAWIYWTNDGSDPVGENGQAINGHVAPLEAVNIEWETLLWGYVRRFRGEIPGQPAGTIVRYRLAAGGNGGERLADEGTYYAFYVDDDMPPTWAQDAIIYQIFADRFFSSASDFPHIEPKPSLKCNGTCLLYTSPSPRDRTRSRMPSSA